MRSLAISTISLLLVLALWFGFMTYCENTLTQLMAQITDEIEIDVTAEDWETAEKSFQQFSQDWHKNKVVYSLFLEQSAMLETDFSIARAEACIYSKDQSNAMAELSAIREQLKFLYQNERITLANIM